MKRLALPFTPTIHLFLFFTLLAARPASAQFTETDLGSQNVAAALVIPLLGPGISASGVTYRGTSWSAGSFTGGTSVVGFPSGIVLSTGQAAAVSGTAPVTASTCNSMPGDASLAALAGAPVTSVQDATVLEFDFVPTFNTITFRYVFASDEYNQYVGSAFNDVFGFFVNGVNVALIPGTSTQVSINNVNDCSNSAYFIDNIGSPQGGGCPVVRPAAGLATSMNGLTTVLTATSSVNPGVTNHIKLAIADIGDCRNDSNVFIEANSFTSAFTNTPTPIFTYTPCGWPGLTCTFTPPPIILTDTFTPTDTPCGWPGLTCTSTISFTATPSPTNTPTKTPTNTFTDTTTVDIRPSNTPTNSPTRTPTSTYTLTPTPLITSTATNSPTPSPTLTPCGWPGNTCTPTFTATLTPTPYHTDIFTLDKNVLNLSTDKSVSLYVNYSDYPGEYTLRIYNTAGEHIQTLDARVLNGPINQTYTWDGTNKNGEACASGVYVFYLVEPFSRKIKRMVLVR